jgi:transcriptional regulator with XRE-family HTH domain
MPSSQRSSHLEAPRTALATVLDAQGRRLAWVARHLDVDSSTVSRWRSGDRPIPERRRDQLAAILGVGAADLIDPPPSAGRVRA